MLDAPQGDCQFARQFRTVREFVNRKAIAPVPNALIIGVSGQDGGLLAAHLLERGYAVVGTSRDAEARSFGNLQRLGLSGRLTLRSMNALELGSILKVLDAVQPDEIYHLGGQSSVGLSFEQPSETLSSIVNGTQNILEAIRTSKRQVRFYSAGSSECFGNTLGSPANETTQFHPISPYAVAKSCAFWQVASYREAYGLFAVTGILFNHESQFRPDRFVTAKIINAARRIAWGSRERLRLGDTGIVRDWGYAPEYVDAMWRMLQQDEPRDFVIATGQSMSLHDFARAAFAWHALDLDDHLDIDRSLFRPSDIPISKADPALAAAKLGWRATLHGLALVDQLSRDFADAGLA